MHAFHQYTVRISSNRDQVVESLRKVEIESGVYYPTPVHQLKSFAKLIDLPNTEKSCHEVLSLPVHPGLSKKDLNRVVTEINQAIEKL